ITGTWLWSRPVRRAPVGRLLGTLVLLIVAVAIVYPRGADPRTLFYPVFPEYYRGWLQLDAQAGPRGARIAYGGTKLPYYLLGIGLRNELCYVNLDEHGGWLMHDYHRQAQRLGRPTWPNPWPAWDRLHADYGQWLANLEARKIDLLVVASMGRPKGALPDADS